MVKVFPELAGPKARIVLLMPCSARLILVAIKLYKSSCLALGPNTWWNFFVFDESGRFIVIDFFSYKKLFSVVTSPKISVECVWLLELIFPLLLLGLFNIKMTFISILLDLIFQI